MVVHRNELQRLLQKANQHEKEQAKKAGASIYYIENGKRIREDASGKKFEVIYDASGKRSESIYHGKL